MYDDVTLCDEIEEGFAQTTCIGAYENYKKD
jgi:hypothetical protein